MDCFKLNWNEMESEKNHNGNEREKIENWKKWRKKEQIKKIIGNNQLNKIRKTHKILEKFNCYWKIPIMKDKKNWKRIKEGIRI